MAKKTDDSSEDRSKGNEKSLHRRAFFSEGFRNMFRPLADALTDRIQAGLDRAGLPLHDDEPPARRRPVRSGASTTSSARPSSHAVPDRPVLRPPGAIAEEAFLGRCLSSGQCVASCPVSAIKLADASDPVLDGKPFIDAQSQACVVCEELSCMHACPTGALVPVEKRDIRMGLARLNAELCVRTAGEDCQICVDKCPLGSNAIEIPYEGGMVHVRDPGCTGCGVCEMYCPTEPRAIVVEPTARRGAASVDGGVADTGSSYLPLGGRPEDGSD